MPLITKFIGALWLAGLLLGFADLVRFESVPGSDAPAPSSWPAEAHTKPAPDRPTLIMALHPKCACSLASLESLSRLKAIFPNGFEARLLYYTPKDASPEWAYTTSWQAAERIPAALRTVDPLGAEANAFGATTSGHVLLYSPDGQLLFSGGLTPSRGHSGDNAGLAALTSILRHEQPTVSRTPTFGCSLHATPHKG